MALISSEQKRCQVPFWLNGQDRELTADRRFVNGGLNWFWSIITTYLPRIKLNSFGWLKSKASTVTDGRCFESALAPTSDILSSSLKDKTPLCFDKAMAAGSVSEVSPFNESFPRYFANASTTLSDRHVRPSSESSAPLYLLNATAESSESDKRRSRNNDPPQVASALATSRGNVSK